MNASAVKDRFYMQMALELAQKGTGYTSPNPLVGAVVVKDQKVVGRGYHERYGGAHAEVNALRQAGAQARGATLYVTLEPCNHTGQTPPCTAAILAAGIRRVVVAMRDPNPGVKGGGSAFLRQSGIDVVDSVAEEAARRQNPFFLKHIQTGMPFVILKCAATLDGRIATRTGDAQWVSGPESRQFVHELRHAMDAIMVGVDTVKIDNPSLTTRRPDGSGSDPTRIILDTRLSTPVNARVLTQASTAETIVVTSPDVSAAKRQPFIDNGVRVMDCRCREGRIDLTALMKQLGAEGIASVLIEGGSRVSGSALRSGIVDKLYFFYAPKLLGGDDGVPICRGPGPERMQDCLNIADMIVHRFGRDVMLEGNFSPPTGRH
ncbi:MAG: bifunctional diaminohydroxyphosphoribosylaminopyrimidine deaminase/5-amino-6-(5-phosphoribosylamino)uracil reductase RibD [Deltaproteobacteria bacterium]|jgi:diaminohydroxyphosphoribosylaminopyrimidine deaminase/5-amino-6-(5-phosphoribosylamino)uracil reductase|nr:bifunctional diaminohydroxyphosphoribosylaminopyrimidine deaminase/5-amino-6-(5-phosphoribosylamino)uracil reductase RibD [Deltaproteobacteria bacterium]